jgi:cytochrome P450
MTTAAPAVDPLFEREVVQDPSAYYRELREHDPVHEIPGTGTFLVTKMDHIYQVVAKPDVFSSMSYEFLHKGDWALPGLRPAGSGEMSGEGSVLATADPPDHTRQRKVISRRLSTSSMQAMEPEFHGLVKDALATIGSDGRIDWMSLVAEPLPMVMVARILGLSDAYAPELKRQGYAMVERISAFVPEDRIQFLEDEGINGLASVIQAYGEARQGSTAYDHGLIGILAHAVAAGEMTDAEVFGTLVIVISAGGESTTSLTGTAVRILAEQPDLQDRLRADPSLIPTFIEEALRFDPPFRGHYRVATQDAELGGKTIPAGSHLVLMWPSANHDEDTYEDPEAIRLDRAHPRQHVGFGAGIHLCVGAPLARVEAKSAVEELLAATHSFRIDDEKFPLQYHNSLLVRRLITLPLVLELAP